MTRFMISLEQGVQLVWHAFEDMVGGEIYVKKIPSMKITDVAASIAPAVAPPAVPAEAPAAMSAERRAQLLQKLASWD